MCVLDKGRKCHLLSQVKFSLTVTVSVLIENSHQTVSVLRWFSIRSESVTYYLKKNFVFLWQFRFSSRTIIRLCQSCDGSPWEQKLSQYSHCVSLMMVLDRTESITYYSKKNVFLLWQFRFSPRTVIILCQFQLSSRTIIRLCQFRFSSRTIIKLRQSDEGSRRETETVTVSEHVFLEYDKCILWINILILVITIR